MKSVIITGQNLVPNIPYNNTFQYNFPNGSVTFKDHEIAVGQVNIYNSWYNISALKKNNQFQYYWPSGAGWQTNPNQTGQETNTKAFLVTIPDGTYDVTQLNQFLQYTFIANKHYLIDGSGNYLYYMELLWNPTKALVEFIAYPVPSTLGTYTQPPGAPALPNSSYTPVLEILDWGINSFGKMIGFWDTQLDNVPNYGSALYPPPSYATGPGSTTSYYGYPYVPYVTMPIQTPVPITPPTTFQTTIFNQLAALSDILYRVVSLNMTCSLLYNNLALPCTLIYSFPVASTPFGEIVTSIPATFGFIPIKDGIYTDFTISFFDQDNNPIYVRDKDLNVLMMIRKRGEGA
jgi:hypothetical protein